MITPERCNICDDIVLIKSYDYGMDSYNTYDCKCGHFMIDEFSKRQKYSKLIKKYAMNAELLTEILCDLK